MYTRACVYTHRMRSLHILGRFVRARGVRGATSSRGRADQSGASRSIEAGGRISRAVYRDQYYDKRLCLSVSCSICPGCIAVRIRRATVASSLSIMVACPRICARLQGLAAPACCSEPEIGLGQIFRYFHSNLQAKIVFLNSPSFSFAPTTY